ncbi:unnamed protein product [Paramecium primaurelia]|uniref:Uncharacterized protein n=1 Tax=Paramecium primaurelia TaxID=5886 RepID=A0A8S1KRB6_PARPR|nr:unnamed protein product [Paramecium primaurelia]
MRQDYQLCGIFDVDEYDKNVIFAFQKIHFSKNIFIKITSNLDQGAENESWDIVMPKRMYDCQDNMIPCDFWIHVKSFWQTPCEFDGWKIDDNQTLSSSVCAGLNIAGGYPNLRLNQTVENSIFNLSSHFNVQVEFQFWLFGNWLDDQFILKLDDYELLNQHINQSAHFINCGGIKQNVSFINLRAQMNHSQSSMKITFTTQSNSTLNKYWGINTFDLYIRKCSNYCEKCNGPGDKQCTACIKNWVIFKEECILLQQNSSLKLRLYQLSLITIQYFKQYSLNLIKK